MTSDGPTSTLSAMISRIRQHGPDLSANILIENAVHEAGHAVAARAFGREVYSATANIGIPMCQFCTVMDTPEQAREVMVVCAAGAAASRRHGEDSPNDGGGEDRNQMRRIAIHLHGKFALRKDIKQEMDRADELANRLVEQYWNEIKHIAAVLVAQTRAIDEAVPRTIGIHELEQPP